MWLSMGRGCTPSVRGATSPWSSPSILLAIHLLMPSHNQPTGANLYRKTRDISSVLEGLSQAKISSLRAPHALPGVVLASSVRSLLLFGLAPADAILLTASRQSCSHS